MHTQTYTDYNQGYLETSQKHEITALQILLYYNYRNDIQTCIQCNTLLTVWSFHEKMVLMAFFDSGDFCHLLKTFCKQFGPRSRPTECLSWSGSNPYDILIVFLKNFLKTKK